MPDNVNPYIPGQAVDNPDLFFGRREPLTSIRENLVKGRRVFVISGAPRLGKSSLLRQVPHHLPEDFCPVRMDLVEENAHKLDWLLWRLADAIAHQAAKELGLQAPTWAEFEGHGDTFFDRFWPQARLALQDRCLLLLVDDIHLLAEAHLLDPFLAFLADWRERDREVALVLTAPPARQEALVRDHPRLLAGALVYPLGPLNSEEATRLITWPVDGLLTYDYGVARRMIEVTSGQPYYLQLLCFEIFNRCAATGWVNQRDVDVVVEDLVGREIADFRQVWEESSPREQAVLAALVSLRGARGVATIQEVRTILNKAGSRAERDQVAAALESLTTRGILERLGALSYRFRVGLLRDWLVERLDLQEVVRNMRWGGADRGRSGDKRQVSRLKPGRARRRAAPPRDGAPPGSDASAADGQEAPRPGVGIRRPWLWITPLLVVGLALVAVLGWNLFDGPPPEPTPTIALRPTFTPIYVTATPSLTTVVASQTPLPAGPPSDTPTPRPSNTPSPTPPIVLARSMPSIAYQSRESGESTWSLYVMNADGSNRAAISRGQSGFLAPPSWSPDGSRIAFVSDRTGTADIWVVDRDGGNAVDITPDEAKDHSPAWSPDGEWIAFASLRDALYWELYLMRPDGSDVQRLTWWEDASDLYPSWSPDGTRLAFASKRDGNWEIYTMDRDGTNLVRLTQNLADDINPAWSPDGSRIAFESTRDGYAEIFVMAISGGEAVNVSHAPFSSEHGPTWSPDGGRIAFYSDQDGEWDIYVMASDGSDVAKLTGDNTNDQVPAWRP